MFCLLNNNDYCSSETECQKSGQETLPCVQEGDLRNRSENYPRIRRKNVDHPRIRRKNVDHPRIRRKIVDHPWIRKKMGEHPVTKRNHPQLRWRVVSWSSGIHEETKLVTDEYVCLYNDCNTFRCNKYYFFLMVKVH